MDYSKWDTIAAEEDREEQQRKAEQRRKNKDDYFRQQQERIQQHQQQQQQQSPPSTVSPAPTHHDAHDHQHQHDEHHSHDQAHDHSHDQLASAAPSSTSSGLAPYRRSCGCGFTDVDALLAMQKQAAANPGPSAEEKRQKQLSAITAVRSHAKELYAAQQYQQAYSVYERGALIIAGMTDLPPPLQHAVEQHELAITHNMALCQLQLHNYTHAIELARMALQLTPDRDGPEATKAHYRLLQCHVRLGQWEEAGLEVAEIGKRGGWKGVEDEVRLMRRMKEAEKVKEREFRARMKEKMRAEAEKVKERQMQKMDERKEGGIIDAQ